MVPLVNSRPLSVINISIGTLRQIHPVYIACATVSADLSGIGISSNHLVKLSDITNTYLLVPLDLRGPSKSAWTRSLNRSEISRGFSGALSSAFAFGPLVHWHRSHPWMYSLTSRRTEIHQ